MFNGHFNHRIEHLDRISSPLFGSYDEYLDQSYHESDQGKTRIVWVTNYINNDDFPIYVPIEDPFLHLDHTSSNSSEKDEIFLSNDLSKLNLDDLLLLLYQLQQKTTRNSVMLSNSAISSSSSDSMVRQPSSHPSLTTRLSHTVQSFHTQSRQSSSFPLTNIADIPKQFMSTLIKPITPSYSKHLHSPDDVVNQLLQSYYLRTSPKKSSRSSYSSICTYQQSEQHKAKLISNLLANNTSFH